MQLRKALSVLGVMSALSSVATTMAFAASASAAPNHPICPPPLVWNAADNACDDRPKPPKPPPVNPYGAVDPVTRTATLDLHVTGWAIDPDTSSPITVQVVLDGKTVGTTTANGYRSSSNYHGFDTTVAADTGAHQLCVIGVNVGPGSNTSIGCQSIDAIADFQIDSISYDLNQAQILSTTVNNVYTDSVSNGTSVTQSSEFDGSTTVTDTQGWSVAKSIQVGVKADIGIDIPILADGKIEVSAQASDTYTLNGSSSTAVTWSWRQPVIVPANSQVRCTVTLAESQISVPYTLTGRYVSQSGVSTPATFTATPRAVGGLHHA